KSRAVAPDIHRGRGAGRAACAGAGKRSDAGAGRGGVMKILWLKTELLHPVDKGGRIRTYAMLREIAKQHEVTYLTLDDGRAAPDAVAKAAEYCARLERVTFDPPERGGVRFYADLLRNVFSSLPYAISRYRSRAF